LQDGWHEFSQERKENRSDGETKVVEVNSIKPSSTSAFVRVLRMTIQNRKYFSPRIKRRQERFERHMIIHTHQRNSNNQRNFKQHHATSTYNQILEDDSRKREEDSFASWHFEL
jgi:hypothetical protein